MKPGESQKQTELNTCLDKAGRAIDLSIKELIETRGGQVGRRGDEWQFLIALSRETSTKRLRTELKGYLTRCRDNSYHFEESSRKKIIGDIRPIDLVISGHFTSETLERFVVVDLEGEIRCPEDGLSHGDYVRFETWCRLYYLPKTQGWFVHYVDIIIRHKSPMQRVLFMFEHGKSGEVVRAKEQDPKELCLFFESPQGGTWG